MILSFVSLKLKFEKKTSNRFYSQQRAEKMFSCQEEASSCETDTDTETKFFKFTNHKFITHANLVFLL